MVDCHVALLLAMTSLFYAASLALLAEPKIPSPTVFVMKKEGFVYFFDRLWLNITYLYITLQR